MIDKKITWALILALTVESAGVFSWAGATGERLSELEMRVSAQAEMAVRLARVEVQLELAAAQLERIERKLDRQPTQVCRNSRQRRLRNFQTRYAMKTESLVIEGYASLFGVEDLAGDRVRAGAFAQTLRRRGEGRELREIGLREVLLGDVTDAAVGAIRGGGGGVGALRNVLAG
jgi:DNA repair ATPase RecN